jgi:hypothetical protein
MGQRLNIEVIINGERMANGYYHWGAYTNSALCEVTKCIDFYNKHVKGKVSDPVLIAVQTLLLFSPDLPKPPSVPSHLAAMPLLSLLSGLPGLSENSLQYMKEKYPNIEWPEANSRNNGLISCVDEEMDKTEAWEEGRISIYIDEEKICFHVLSLWELEDYLEYCEDEDCNAMHIVMSLPILNLDPFDFSFDKLKMMNTIFSIHDEYIFYDENGELMIMQSIN